MNGKGRAPRDPDPTGWSEARRKLTSWLIFVVAFGLLPLVAIALNGISRSLTFADVFGRGDLYVVSVAVTANAVGEVLTSPSRRSGDYTGAIAGCCMLMFAGNLMAYMNADRPQPSITAWISLGLFVPSMIASGICIRRAVR